MKAYRWDSATDHELRVSRARIIFALVVLLILAGGLVLRMFFLQVVQHAHYTTLSRDNRLHVVPILPQRGEIYSSDGVLLAGNLATYNLVAQTERRPGLSSRPELLRLGQLLGAAVESMLRTIHTARPNQQGTLVLLEGLSEEQVAKFSVHQHLFPGIAVQTGFRRYYPLADVFAHVVGRIGGLDERDLAAVAEPEQYRLRNRIGKIGIEKRYEELLRGRMGYHSAEVNADGRIVRILETVPPRQGEALVLNINADLQLEAYTALAGRRGAVVAIEPTSGRVLALVNTPSYDPNPFTTGLDRQQYQRIKQQAGAPLFNRSTDGQYPPGSVIKPFLAQAALAGTVSSDQVIHCPGWFRINGAGRRFRDWKTYGHGAVDLVSALEQSCDVYFYGLALQLGIEGMAAALEGFGFGSATGIDLDGEHTGLIPDPQWKQARHQESWYTGETVITGIGQGYMLVTPVQLAVATAALATDGWLPVPVLLGERRNPLTDEWLGALPPPAGSHLPGSAVQWEQVRQGMRRVVHGERGTARGIAIGLEGYEIAGKTGTAQVVVRELSGTSAALEDHALFIAYAPIREPRIALAVVIENSGSGSKYAAPLARRLFDHYLRPAMAGLDR